MYKNRFQGLVLSATEAGTTILKQAALLFGGKKMDLCLLKTG